MSSIDHLWILTCSCFVFFMQAGFICYEVGFIQSKNVISVAIENILAFVTATLAFCMFGFAVMFGPTFHGLIGTNYWFLQSLTRTDDYVFIFFQLMFAGTAVTIFSGSMSERTKLKPLILSAFIMGALIYPLYGHWAWAGLYHSQSTFLSKLGFIDFAGATVVHASAGWVALAGIITVGPRKGRFDRSGANSKPGRSNIPFAALGTFILWFSWFGFNGGSLLRYSNQAGLILLNTNIAASAGVVGALLLTHFFIKDHSYMEAIFNGALGGLVGITACSNILNPSQALMLGFVTGAVVVGGSLLLEKLKLDDAVGAVPIHAFGGVSGTLLCCLFASPEMFHGHTRLQQLGIQSLGILMNFVCAFGIGLLMFRIIDKTMGLRVTEEEEEKGLNIVEFGDIYTWMEYLKSENYENKIQEQNVLLQRQAVMLAATQEQERVKVARDLHDGVGQSLAALKINLGLIRGLVGENPSAKQQVERTLELVGGTIEEMRGVIYNLKPKQLREEGLLKSIQSTTENLSRISGITFTYTVVHELPQWGETEELNIYRILQESLTNILKHSRATEVNLLLTKQPGQRFLFLISDNGRGFDINISNRGIGLTSMTERAEMLNGRFHVESSEGAGTKILLEVPYE